MKTILRRMVDNTEEYYCVINHSLEEFTLDVLHSWEMNDEVNPISYRVNKVIQIPDYVSTLKLNGSTSDVLDTKYSIVDKDNLFALVYRALCVYNPLKLLKDFPGSDWVFTRRGIYLKTPERQYPLLAPFDSWRGDTRVYLDDAGNSSILNKVLSVLETIPSKPALVGVDINKYMYSVFRTAWYDIIVYLECTIMHLELLNEVARIAARWEQKDITGVILPKLIERDKRDVSVELLFNKLNRRLHYAKNLPEIYSAIDTFDNTALKPFYNKLVGQLTFITEDRLDWEKYNTLYKQYLDNYLLAAISYLRWNFIRSYVDIPENFNEPLVIQTPIGKLIVRGGDPVWDT